MWGFAAGAFRATLGLLVSAAVLTDDPPRRTRRLAKVGLVLSAVALAAAAAIVLAIVIL